MSIGPAAALFFCGAAVSLTASWVLVSRIERIAAHFGISGALLGILSALCADAPEITSAVSAVVGHQGTVGAGVVVGSNVFNLAALIGLGAIVAGGIGFHRRAIALEGTIAVWMAGSCMLLVTGVAPATVSLALAAVMLVPYVAVSALSHSPRWRRDDARRVQRWLRRAIVEEELEIGPAVRGAGARPVDGVVAAMTLGAVLVASVVMEHAAVDLGERLHVSDIVVGGVALAAVTSLPNAVAAIYWARRGLGTATLGTALNSNSLNVAVGLLVPAVAVGIGRLHSGEVFVAAWYSGLTVFTIIVAYRGRGVARAVGWTIVLLYGVFLTSLLVTA